MEKNERGSAEKKRKTPLIRRLALIVLLAGVLTYIGVYVYQALYDPMGTAEAIAFTATDSVDVSGWVVRDETPITVENEYFSVAVSDGARVGKSQSVAVAYNSLNAYEQSRELRELENQRAQLEYSLEFESTATSAAALENTISASLESISAMTAGEDLTGLAEVSSALKGALLRRDYVSGGIEGISEKIAETTGRIDSIKQQLASTATAIASPSSGTYSSYIDGLERALTPYKVSEMTPEELEAAATGQTETAAGTVGKIVGGTRWYYAYITDSAQAEALRNRSGVSLGFKGEQRQPCSMRIEQVGLPDASGRCLVLLSSADSFADVLQTRQADAEIIFSSYTGLRIPKEALHMDEDGVTGVYCISGVQTTFKTVDIIWIMDEYYVVKEDTASARALKEGEEVVVHAKGLYEGKIVK